MKTSAGAVLLIFSASAFAQDMPVPKMFRGMQGQKGQYQVEFLEGGGRAGKAAPTMTVCTDNLMNASKGGGDQPRANPAASISSSRTPPRRRSSRPPAPSARAP
jgi:hypothetical protein